jgi:hypothetical protein
MLIPGLGEASSAMMVLKGIAAGAAVDATISSQPRRRKAVPPLGDLIADGPCFSRNTDHCTEGGCFD